MNDRVMLRAEPRLNAAYAVELTEREQLALMTQADWEWMLDKYFADELRPGLEDRMHDG